MTHGKGHAYEAMTRPPLPPPPLMHDAVDVVRPWIATPSARPHHAADVVWALHPQGLEQHVPSGQQPEGVILCVYGGGQGEGS